MKKVPDKSSVAAVIVAAGQSRRMGRVRDKVWMSLAGKPILYFSLHAFLKAGISNIVVVARASDTEFAAKRIKTWKGLDRMKLQVVAGGKERQDSVWEGIHAADARYCLIHDAARPAVTPDIIRRVLRHTRIHGACVPAVPVRDTTKKVNAGRVVKTVERKDLVSVHTPQGFLTSNLVAATILARKRNVTATDCAALVENSGKKVVWVNSSSHNIKITTPDDLVVIESILRNRRRASRRLHVS